MAADGEAVAGGGSFRPQVPPLDDLASVHQWRGIPDRVYQWGPGLPPEAPASLERVVCAVCSQAQSPTLSRHTTCRGLPAPSSGGNPVRHFPTVVTGASPTICASCGYESRPVPVRALKRVADPVINVADDVAGHIADRITRVAAVGERSEVLWTNAGTSHGEAGEFDP